MAKAKFNKKKFVASILSNLNSNEFNIKINDSSHLEILFEKDRFVYKLFPNIKRKCFFMLIKSNNTIKIIDITYSPKTFYVLYRNLINFIYRSVK